MAKRRKAPLWQRPFLRALGRTGNVAQAALAAGVDKSTVYLRRKAHADFAAKWEAAAARARGPLHRASPVPMLRIGLRGRQSPGLPRMLAPTPRAGEELVLRSSKRGAQFVKAAPGRWSATVEARFLAMLARSGNVRCSGAAAGISTTALYNRRKAYPRFAADWDAAEAEAGRRIPGFLTSAMIATFDPEVAEALAGENLPKVTIAEGIAIARLKGLRVGAGAGRGRGRPLPSIEEVRANILRKLDEIEAHEKG